MNFKILLFCSIIVIFLTASNPAPPPVTGAEFNMGISQGGNYRRLEKAYNYLSRSEWPIPGELPLMKQGDKDSSVLKLKNYLRATGDLRGNRAYFASSLFDERLSAAVSNFQARHGLKPDGVVGKNTLEKMNIPLSYRLKQLQANIDRLKTLPEDFGQRFIIVNIPAFFLEYYERGRVKTSMNVVVGDIENYTPVLQDTMSYIVFNPSWNVPVSIATKELLPEAQSDAGYFEKNNYAVLKGSYTSKDTIDARTVNWNEYSEDNFPFSIIQKPGENNALGKIKFMFPNNFDIYLHDTPSDQVFNLEKRDLSHGCVRLEKPVELAKILLSGQMDPEEIDDLLAEEETKNIKLDNQVVVHLVYQTAWIDEDGRLQFRDDIYEIDKSAM
ncbi:MAG: L,D-transpeptidase family protein [Methanosarcina sp.]